jgi:hypothetical protein
MHWAAPPQCNVGSGSPQPEWSAPAHRRFTARGNTRGRGIQFHFVDSAGEEHDFSAKKCME